MQFTNLIETVNTAYPDDLVQRVFCGEDVGDTLALFIVRELKDSFDPKAGNEEQLNEAIRVMEKASDDLKRVVQALYEKRNEHC